MLWEPQARALLERCEAALGAERLRSVRGNLRRAKSRGAAVWELLVLNEALELGAVEYEPGEGGSPDVRLTAPGARPLWIEARFLYPRFWREGRNDQEVRAWILTVAHSYRMGTGKLSIHLDGDRSDPRGPVRKLPHPHERREFERHPELHAFFERVQSNPSEPATCTLSNYTVTIGYHPQSNAPQAWVGGLVQEAPRVVREHAVYRALCEKAKQHDVSGPRVVAIGSDQSPVLGGLRGPLTVRVEDAVGQAFREHRSLSAALLVSVSSETEVFRGMQRRARAHLYLNANAREPLSAAEVQLLLGMNFNRWTFAPVLDPWEPSDRTWHRRMSVQFTYSWRDFGLKITIPVSFLAEVLRGKASISEVFGEDHPVTKTFEAGYEVASCEKIPGNIEDGSLGDLELEMVPPGFAAYWPAKQEKKSKS